MKCELCHNAEAETAIADAGGDDELYVCRECARREKVRRQNSKRSVRKAPGSGRAAAGAPAPEHALEHAAAERIAPEPERIPDEPVDLGFLPHAIGLAGGMHLEGLFLIGDIEAVERAMRALDISMEGLKLDGLQAAGHVFAFKCAKGGEEAAGRAVKDLAARETAARKTLELEYPRVLGDAVCRALAILKNARLLSQGELFDLLSPLRLAALSGYLDGIDAKQVEKLMKKAASQANKDEPNPDVRDRVDGELADRMNNMFEDVILGEDGERDFL